MAPDLLLLKRSAESVVLLDKEERVEREEEENREREKEGGRGEREREGEKKEWGKEQRAFKCVSCMVHCIFTAGCLPGC